MSYATLDDVKQHLRYDDNSNDVVLQSYLDASEQVINQFITDAVTDNMRPALKVACLLLCGHFDDDRNAKGDTMTAQGNVIKHPTYSTLPNSIQLLLQPYRKPTAV